MNTRGEAVCIMPHPESAQQKTWGKTLTGPCLLVFSRVRELLASYPEHKGHGHTERVREALKMVDVERMQEKWGIGVVMP